MSMNMQVTSGILAYRLERGTVSTKLRLRGHSRADFNSQCPVRITVLFTCSTRRNPSQALHGVQKEVKNKQSVVLAKGEGKLLWLLLRVAYCHFLWRKLLSYLKIGSLFFEFGMSDCQQPCFYFNLLFPLSQKTKYIILNIKFIDYTFVQSLIHSGADYNNHYGGRILYAYLLPCH